MCAGGAEEIPSDCDSGECQDATSRLPWLEGNILGTGTGGTGLVTQDRSRTGNGSGGSGWDNMWLGVVKVGAGRDRTGAGRDGVEQRQDGSRTVVQDRSQLRAPL